MTCRRENHPEEKECLGLVPEGAPSPQTAVMTEQDLCPSAQGQPPAGLPNLQSLPGLSSLSCRPSSHGGPTIRVHSGCDLAREWGTDQMPIALAQEAVLATV